MASQRCGGELLNRQFHHGMNFPCSIALKVSSRSPPIDCYGASKAVKLDSDNVGGCRSGHDGSVRRFHPDFRDPRKAIRVICNDHFTTRTELGKNIPIFLVIFIMPIV